MDEMTDLSTPPPARATSQGTSTAETPAAAASSSASLWARIREHKVLQWSLAYLGAALALAHGQELVGHAFDWPEISNRIVIGALAVGFPVAVALAWYHGHKGLTRISAGEMTVVSVLLVIGAGLLMALVRTPAEQTEPQTNALRPVPAPAATLSTTGSPASTAAPIVTPVAATPRQHSIAVLPFVDMSEKKDQEYFADGMAEEITDLLARIPGITVMSRTSSFQFKGRNEDLRTLGASLGVAYVLEGSVRKS